MPMKFDIRKAVNIFFDLMNFLIRILPVVYTHNHFGKSCPDSFLTIVNN